MNEKNAEKVLYTLDDEFKFSCNGALACYNTCCRDINIFLTPYDVLRMRKGSWMPSDDFLQKYTVALLGEEGLPLVVLKMNENKDKTCPFVAPEGCGIYQGRPWSCRMYPVFPISSDADEFLIEEKASCHGFKGGKQSTVREWKKAQDIDVYDRMNQPYKEITHHTFFLNGNKLDIGKTKLVYSTCYDLDSFKRFIFETRFLDIYDIEEDLIAKMKKDEEELLLFAYKWVRFSLFSEDILKLKDKEMDKLMKSRNKEAS
ncbi:MAG: YkgJ family cysteine cluster protein [Syntrophobacteraceae bacterium]